MGTFDYISPEQARDPRSADVRSDLYSLGCSFFYMLTGRPPFPDGTVLQKLLQHQADHPPDPRTVRPELPVEVTWILARLLAKNPAQRFQHPSELTTQLTALGNKLGLQLSSARTAWTRPRPQSPIARWKRHVPWVVPLAALFLIVLALDYASSAPEPKETVGAAAAKSSVPLPSREPAANEPKPPATKPRNPREVPPSQSAPVARARPSAEPGFSSPSLDPANDAPAVSDASGAEPARVPDSFGAGLNAEELRARASTAANAASRVGPQPAGTTEETGISGADATIAQPIVPTTANTSPSREGILIVSGTETGDRVYSSLHAACNNAKSGDVIELRYNGRRLEEPITISNIKLTIRAGERFQPVIVFRPEPNPVKYPPSMMTIAGGQLNVANVHWELDVPRDLPGDWALMETRRADLLRFEKCTFTIRNASLGQTAYHSGVAFFDIKAPPGSGTVTMDQGAPDDHVVTIDLQNCLARGEAAFLRDNELQPLRLQWVNGLLATSEQFLVAAGGPSQPRQLGFVQINLRHVTAMLRAGLALLTNSEDAPYQLSTDINCGDSILASAAGSPLVEQRGSDSVEEYLSRLQWSGDHDFFDGVDIFWRIVDAATQISSKQADFDQWQQFWSGRSKSAVNAPLAWRNPPHSDRPFHTHTADDYSLDASADDNPAVGGAGDGLDAGYVAKQLIALPPDESTEASGAPSKRAAPARSDDDS